MRFIAYITKGLDRVVKQEILEYVPSAEIQQTSDKYLILRAPAESASTLLDLKTVDDIHYLLTFTEHNNKPDTDVVLENSSTDDVFKAVELIRSIRTLDNTVSVTASRYKNDNIAKEDLKTTLGNRLASALSFEYTPRDHSNLDIRVHVEKNNVIESVRLTEKPLYYREYKQHSREGSLRPSIAAALVRLTDPEPGDKLVDNFCGVGTILCEGVLQGVAPHGGDIDEQAVRYAKDHLRSFSRDWVRNVHNLDATDSKLPNDYFDIAVSNIPWGEQLDLNAVELYSQAVPEYKRILADTGSVVLLGPKPDLAEKHLKEQFPDHNVGKFRLGFLGQHPWVTFAYSPEKSLNMA